MTKLRAAQAALAGACLTLFGGAALAQEALGDYALGVWERTNRGWLVEFKPCDDNAELLCGEVISGEGEDRGTGGPVVGVQMLYDLERVSDDRWRGRMYNPGDGGTYRGTVTVLSENEIRMSGCMMRVMCRSETWPRAAEPEETVEEVVEEVVGETVVEAIDEAAAAAAAVVDDE